MDEIARNSSEPLLTAEDIARRLAAIHAAQGDDEVAHGMEDDLHRDVLATIAAGASDAPLLASAALRTQTLDFARWCAWLSHPRSSLTASHPQDRELAAALRDRGPAPKGQAHELASPARRHVSDRCLLLHRRCGCHRPRRPGCLPGALTAT